MMNRLTTLTESCLIDMFIAFRNNNQIVSLCDIDADEEMCEQAKTYWRGMAVLCGYSNAEITNEVLFTVVLIKGGALYFIDKERNISYVITLKDVKNAIQMLKEKDIDVYNALHDGTFERVEILCLFGAIKYCANE